MSRRTSMSLLIVMTAMMLVSIVPNAAAAPTYTLTVNVYTTSASTPNGLNVTLSNAASGVTCTATTYGGQSIFTSSSCAGLSAGWWRVNVPPQMFSFAGNSWMVTPPNSTGVGVTMVSTTLSATTSFTGVSVTAANITVTGILRGLLGGSTARVSVLDPAFTGFVVNSTTVRANSMGTARYTITKVPWGTWTVYAYGDTNSSINIPRYNYSTVVVGSGTIVNSSVSHNVALQNYLVQGYYGTSGLFSSPSNITVWDTVSHRAFATSWLAINNSKYFQAGLYPSGVGSSGAAQSFVVFLSPQGYTSSWKNVTVSSSSSTYSFNPTIHPEIPTNYSTVINFGSNFSKVNVASNGVLTHDSTFATLPNASVGDLWAQIGLDFNHSYPAVDSSTYVSFIKWLTSSGPIYPVQSEGLSVNGTPFTDNGTYTLVSPAYGGPQAYYSTAGFAYSTQRNYTLSPMVKSNASSYHLNVGFDYPLSSQNLSYTVNLPKGYVLANSTTVPQGTTLVPAGPVGPLGKLWTSFTILPHTYSKLSGSWNFTIYKITNVTAVVNVTSTNFAFSLKNILNQTHKNYTVEVGMNQNVSFTSSHSLVPSTMNVTAFVWKFGDGSGSNSTNSTVHHIYKTGGVYSGSLTLIASGGNQNLTKFTVYVDSVPPKAHISLNNTHTTSLGGSSLYVRLNWSQSLQLNASGSVDTIDPSVNSTAHPGIISVAFWNITAGPTYHTTYNYSVSKNANVFSNFTFQFLGAGHYMKGKTTVLGRTLNLTGWLYNVSLTLWDAGGNKANSTLYVLVNDTEKPIALGSIQNSAGKNITIGTVEGKNGTAAVKLLDKYSMDPHNGSIASFSWYVTNSAGVNFSNCHINATLKCYWNSTIVQTIALYLPASTANYSFTLKVTDLAGNKANSTIGITVAQNLTIRPILTLSNLTAPSTMTDGSGYTIWVNVNNTGFSTSKALNTSILFYITNPDGSSGKTVIGGSPASVKWFGYTHGKLNSTPSFTGILPLILANQSWRAQISYTPPNGFTGSKVLWANGTAANEFAGEYKSGANVVHQPVTLNPSSWMTTLEIVALVVAVIVVLAIVIFILRKRQTGRFGSKKDISKDKKKPTKEASDKETTKEDEEGEGKSD